jgi:ferric-dicitrate binding protein FerR (iron transport regulator)
MEDTDKMDLPGLKKAVHNYLNGKSSHAEKLMFDHWFEEAAKEADADTDQYDNRKRVVLHNLRAAIQAGGQAKDRAKVLPMLKWAAAACVLGMLVTGYLLRDDITGWITPAVKYTVSTDGFQVKEVVLPDSSVVVLNTNSEICYSATFNSRRKIKVSGEAYFDVRKNPAVPFIVSGAHLDITVLGTSFTITDMATARNSSVTVQTGLVQVAAVKDRQTFPALSPRQQLNYDLQTGQGTIRSNVTAVAGWTSKILVFRDTPLKNVFASVEKTFGVKIISNNTAINQRTFTGSFVKEDHLSDILDILSLSYELKIKQVDKTIEVN